jgi:putative DNA primase/helicase
MATESGKSRGAGASAGNGRPPLSGMGQAALFYARRGWPVFPCREHDGEPYKNAKGEMVTPAAKSPYIKGGVDKVPGKGKATVDEGQISAWWRRWPNAMIGLPMGENGLFALDFDPRKEEQIDEATGEVTIVEWTLEQLKADTEAQIGCELPVSLAVRTPSGGVHVYYKQPGDGGAALRNRGVLPQHVDTRGQGGYVIAPPSIIVEPCEGASAGKYRFLRGNRDAEAVEPPAKLVEVLRAPKARANDKAAADQAASASPFPARRGGSAAPVAGDDPGAAAVRRYALSALERECDTLSQTPHGNRNNQANASGFVMGQLVGAGALGESFARSALYAAVTRFNDPPKAQTAIDNGLAAGIAEPRDLSEVAENARQRAERWGSSRAAAAAAPRPSAPAPSNHDEGRQSSRWEGDSGNGAKRGSGAGWDADLTRKCAHLPHTDLGNLERFLARFGEDFLFVEAWGWLAWDGTRWNRDMATALLGRAVQRTMRAIQEEAELIHASGVPWPDPDGETIDSGETIYSDDDDEGSGSSSESTRKKKKKTIMWLRQRSLARRTTHDGPRFDYIAQIKSNGDIVLFSDKIKAWGRTSEGAGHINCIAKLAEARLSARPDDFDSDPLLLNVVNGTIVFRRKEDCAEAGDQAGFERREHRREDRITKICRAEHDPAALCPKYDAFLLEVQPAADMRDFLDVWAGYNALGLADAQKMLLCYGEGSNGKGVWINTHAYILGDYAWAAAIETFIDQGKYRKGSDASPDLAALAGRRMVYANEPEEGSKFSDGLIKSMTSDEPIGGVRELMKPPFELLVTFTNTVSANNRPRIGTDHGIQRRVQVAPWEVIIPDNRADPLLKTKLRAEASGILNRMVQGAVRYLTSGLPAPEAIKEATREYQEENDILGQFLLLAVERVEGNKIGASEYHRVFAGWQTWAQLLPASGKPWSPKYLNAQMQKKGFKISKSSTMQWQGIALRYDEIDFVDEQGKPVTRDLPAPRTIGTAAAPASDPPPPAPTTYGEDDDLPRF